MTENAVSQEAQLRNKIVHFGRLLYERRLAHGSAGNLSALLDDGSILVTPTDTCLGFLEPGRISKVSTTGELIAGDQPSKEAFFHLAVYAERPVARAIVHLHSTYAVAVSCLCHDNADDVLPPLTAYHVMRVGKLPLLKYFRPGDRALAVRSGKPRAAITPCCSLTMGQLSPAKPSKRPSTPTRNSRKRQSYSL